MSAEYVHQDLNQEVTAIGGHYVLTKEVRLPCREREVLYLVGYAVFDTTCCGIGGFAYALVPGFVLHWRVRADESGLAVSLVEPIRGEAVRNEVRRLIEDNETVHYVQFQ